MADGSKTQTEASCQPPKCRRQRHLINLMQYLTLTETKKSPNSFLFLSRFSSFKLQIIPFWFSLFCVNHMAPIVLSQLATGLSVLAGAIIVRSVMDQNPMAGPGSIPRYPTCNGTDTVTYLCVRWSDRDTGCRTCAGLGRMACSSCGGSGTGRPLSAKIAVRRPNRSS
ncbi:hypothetical protein PIB30_050644 [Stylosanthes scabra]|uniref:Uncharacterized protein n=1 Tax=Stylosanthes scabra TaxID=79078 RepID=A0ABU6VIQ6_9FABA|nr:hypothetical protein [Stylosanthes scabra]